MSRPSLYTLRFIGAALLIVFGVAHTGAQTPDAEPDAYPLPLGKTIEREAGQEDSHFYTVELKAGQFLRVETQERRVKLQISLVRAADQKWMTTSLSGFDRETLSFVAEEAGWYVVLVAAQAYSTKGVYRMYANVRQPTAEDKEVMRGERLSAYSVAMYNRGDADSLRRGALRLEESLEIWVRLKDPYQESLTRFTFGQIAYKLGEFGEASQHLGRALRICQEKSDPSCEAWVLNQLGVVYWALGDYEKAFEQLDRANLMFAQLGDAQGAMYSISNLGLVHSDSGNPEWVVKHFEQVLTILKGFNDPRAEAAILSNLGKAYGNLREWQKQLEYVQKALPIFRAVGDRGGEAATLNNIGDAYLKLGESRKTFEYFHQALPLTIAFGIKKNEPRSLSNLMAAARALRRPRLAIFYGKLAVNRLRELRGAASVLERETQQTYLKTVEDIYRGLARLLVEQGRLAEALQVLNSFKDQQFFDFDPSVRKNLAPLSLTPREALFAEKYRLKSERLVAMCGCAPGAELPPDDGLPKSRGTAPVEQPEARFKTASDEILRLLREAEAEFSQLPSARDGAGEVADLREMQAALKELNRSTGHRAVAVYTLVGEDGYHALIVTTDGVAAASHVIKGEELNRRAQQMWALLQRDTYDPRVIARKLYDSVFKPVVANLPPGTDTLLWSLDGNLRYVPMAALYDGKKYLVERYQNVVFTRADRERMTRPVSPKWTGVGLGSSEAHEVSLLGETISFTPLPGVEAELATIFRTQETPSGLLDGEVRRNGSFNRASMLAALRRRRPLVHIASHFLFRPGDEARSFLLLGDGTAMTLAEMKKQNGLFAGVELLTLSACNTAAQRSGARGREIDGFAEMAQRLGAASVLATLWSVADNSTPRLMLDFYMRREDTTKAAALRQAQLALLKGTSDAKPVPVDANGAGKSSLVIVKRGGHTQKQEGVRAEVVYVAEEDAPLFKCEDKKPFAHPYYWAPFILIGNWR